VLKYAVILKKARANVQKTQLNRAFSVILRKRVRAKPVMRSVMHPTGFLFHGMIAHRIQNNEVIHDLADTILPLVS